MKEQEKLIKDVADIIAPFFSDPIDKPCAYCEAAKAIVKALPELAKEAGLGHLDTFADLKARAKKRPNLILGEG